MTQRFLPIIIFGLLICFKQASANDSVLIATLTAEAANLHYSSSDLICGAENAMNDGTVFSSVEVQQFGSHHILLFEGTKSGNGVILAYTLIQHGSQLYLNAALSRTDLCHGKDCAECTLQRDALGRPHCDCYWSNPETQICNHSFSTAATGYITKLKNCAN